MKDNGDCEELERRKDNCDVNRGRITTMITKRRRVGERTKIKAMNCQKDLRKEERMVKEEMMIVIKSEIRKVSC